MTAGHKHAQQPSVVSLDQCLCVFLRVCVGRLPRQLQCTVVAEQQSVRDVVCHFVDRLNDDIMIPQADGQCSATAPGRPTNWSHDKLLRAFIIIAQPHATITTTTLHEHSDLRQLALYSTENVRINTRVSMEQSFTLQIAQMMATKQLRITVLNDIT